ncbi:hypothetical protein EB796_011951 [Bugula neritina]|uniref:TIR domain-containing protein n=1 Tax=Bugula neritina TaxID=10212 RepID=A0A7J7JUV0_BUGNE|nr:hypothetical protein EB796_011951 [Bugula neritina]
MSLRLMDKIEFHTETGPKAIELWFGDITLLPATDKVDLLLLSAFRGNYVPTRTCLIGALFRQLSLSVKDLAEDKEEDLRDLFHCWWSKPLHENLPYRRILCFETNRSRKGITPQRAVKEVFRALVPATGLFVNGVVMSSLLSTGNQGHSEEAMLHAIVNNAATWMKNGLNISTYKLVIYISNEETLTHFAKLKAKHSDVYGPGLASSTILKYDFYLSYVSENEESVNLVKRMFLQHNKSLTFCTSKDMMENVESDSCLADEERIFQVMKSCARVITFLSPAYLEDADRVEEYNAAWCLNRQTTSFTRLAPMLCEGISNLPTYMSLIQWVDIRMQNENKEKPLQNITLYVVTYKQEVLEKDASSDKKTTPAIVGSVEKASDCNYDYDIFISYAHANEETCKIVKEVLEREMPDIKLFIDRQQLHTGGSWQQKLYHALESSHMTLALLSQSYFNSKMCNEEFRLSLARHFTDSNFHLIPLQIEELTDVDHRYLSVNNCVLGNQDVRSYVEHLLAPVIKTFLTVGEKDSHIICKDKTVYHLPTLLADGRNARLVDLIQKESKIDLRKTANKCIQILCASNKFDSDIGLEIKTKLAASFQFKVGINIECEDAAVVLKRLDEADVIVVLMSSHFVKDADLIELLHVAINRQRLDLRVRMYPILLNDLSEGETEHCYIYCQLLPYELCFTTLSGIIQH